MSDSFGHLAREQARGDLAYFSGSEWTRIPAGSSGQVLNVASGAPTWHTLVASDLGGAAWTNVAFAAGNFTASSGDWTVASGDQQHLSYLLLGKSMLLNFTLQTTTVSATPNNLRLTLPLSKTISARQSVNPIVIVNNGTVASGYAVAAAGNTYVQFFRLDGSDWATSTDNTGVLGQIWLETT